MLLGSPPEKVALSQFRNYILNKDWINVDFAAKSSNKELKSRGVAIATKVPIRSRHRLLFSWLYQSAVLTYGRYKAWNRRRRSLLPLLSLSNFVNVALPRPTPGNDALDTDRREDNAVHLQGKEEIGMQKQQRRIFRG